MLSYIAKRIISGIVTVYFIATVTFFAMHFVPGDPFGGAKAIKPEIRRNIMAHYGLDKPLMTQYAIYLKNMAMGDFGISFAQENVSVNDIIREHFPISAELGIFAVIMAAVGGVLFGSLTALYRNQAPDRILMFLVILTISVPGFVLAAISQYAITELHKRGTLEIVPVGGWGTGGLDTFQHMWLPAIVLGVATMAFLVRLQRSSLLEIVGQDYIRTAKAKGVGPVRIFFSHQLRNAILPVISYLGPAIAAITTGGFVAELVFSIPGLGRYFVQAVAQLDYTVIMGLTVFYGAFLVFMAITVDIAYGMIDPRISVTGKKR